MSEFLFHYHRINPTTWVYVSSLMMIGLYFKFGRFWSVRNLDLVLLILLAPGLLFVYFGDAIKRGRYSVDLADSITQLDEAAPVDEDVSDEAATEAIGDEAPLAGEPSETDAETPALPDQPDELNPVAEPDDVELAVETDSEPQTDEAADPVSARVAFGRRIEKAGFIWLFCAGAVLLIRLLLDPTMVRRPLLEPNLSVGGLTFVACSLFVFLMANVITGSPTDDDLKGARGAEQLMSRQEVTEDDNSLARHGPGYRVLNLLPAIATFSLVNDDQQLDDPDQQRQRTHAAIAKTMAILGQLGIILGLVFIGYWHFDNIGTGIGAASLYLMLPYTAQMTGRVDHVLPAAMLVWAIAFYRRPATAGIFMGLATGIVYFPLFLLPLWLSFYWQRGLMRFVVGVVTTLVIVALSLIFTSSSLEMFFEQLRAMFGLWSPVMQGLAGMWDHYDPVWRIPLMAAFFALSGTLAIWPAQKNLGTLMSCSAAVMLTTQFWHGSGGGLYMAWYLPLLLLTIFRPNLEDRVALAVLGESWFPRRRAQFSSVDKAA